MSAATATASQADIASRPLVSILLIAYRQADTVGDALRGAWPQTTSRWRSSPPTTPRATAPGRRCAGRRRATRSGYHLALNRNEHNLGIGAHLDLLAQRAQGELLFVAAGDDVSLPQRVERVVEAWLAQERRPDLIASALADLDAEGRVHGEIVPSDRRHLARAVGGAAAARGRRRAGVDETPVDRFGPLPPAPWPRDLVMVFRALGSGGAITLREPLVQCRRGGISQRRRKTGHASDA